MTFGITAFAIYFIIWWVMLFETLPFSGKTQAEAGEVVLGTVESAPANHRMFRLMAINTVTSALVFAALWYSINHLGLSFETFDFLGPQSLNN